MVVVVVVIMVGVDVVVLVVVVVVVGFEHTYCALQGRKVSSQGALLRLALPLQQEQGPLPTTGGCFTRLSSDVHFQTVPPTGFAPTRIQAVATCQ